MLALIKLFVVVISALEEIYTTENSTSAGHIDSPLTTIGKGSLERFKDLAEDAIAHTYQISPVYTYQSKEEQDHQFLTSDCYHLSNYLERQGISS